MKSLPCDLIIPCGVGVVLLVVAGVQYDFGNVYTRGGRGVQLHAETFVSKEEAPDHFWIIIGMQVGIGIALMTICGAPIDRQLP